jgi:co-chaperonin GroES (HSP10)
MATKFTPLHDRILVRRVEEAETTRGGIRKAKSSPLAKARSVKKERFVLST